MVAMFEVVFDGSLHLCEEVLLNELSVREGTTLNTTAARGDPALLAEDVESHGFLISWSTLWIGPIWRRHTPVFIRGDADAVQASSIEVKHHGRSIGRQRHGFCIECMRPRVACRVVDGLRANGRSQFRALVSVLGRTDGYRSHAGQHQLAVEPRCNEVPVGDGGLTHPHRVWR